ncbi:DUF916 domain-containing protein [uncultured Jatrophihabitans sp.]|uniref:DUF916 domain-containing protein n=1 Tax=uncultured Jatrophihabitans sp. TaxID=1610747 RepID=UPI0035CA1C76
MTYRRPAALLAGLLVIAPTVLGAAAGAAPRHGVPGRKPATKSANAEFGIQAATRGKPDTRAQLTYSATPGARLADQVAVANLGPRPLSLRVYAAAATADADGNFALQPAAVAPTDLATWLTVGASSVRVPARTAKGPSHVIVPISLFVPRTATPGDHAAGVVVSLRSSVRNKQGVLVQLDQRVGLRVYVRVSGPIHAGLAVRQLRFEFDGPAFGNPLGVGVARLSYRVQNTGNVLLGATQRASVSSLIGGTTALTNLPVVPPLLPGASVTIERRVPDVFPGIHLSAAVHLTPVPPVGASDPKLSQASASAGLWAIPWTLLVLLLVVIGGLGGALWWWHRPKPAPAGRASSHRKSSALARSGATR